MWDQGLVFRENNTSYSALATALAATIGTGNIIGISTAIAVSGSAVFWCWITGVPELQPVMENIFVHEIPQNGKRWKEDRRSDMYWKACSRKHGLIFCVYDISVAWDRQQCAGTFDQCGNHGTDTGIARISSVWRSGGACGSVIIGGSRQIGKYVPGWFPVMSAFYFRRMYFYPYEKLYGGDPGGSKMIVTSAFVRGCRAVWLGQR